MLEEEAHTPLEIVHTKVFVPVIKLVTAEVLSVGVVTLDPPAITVHKPVPTVGAFAFKVNMEAHKFCEDPAFEVVGTSSTISAMVELDAVQGRFEIVHAKILTPKPNPVIVVFGEVGFVIVPEPPIKVHKPVPTVGVFADMMELGEEIQIV